MHRFMLVVIMIFTVVAGPSWADTYEWTDSKGVVNFTDDLDKVPAKYRTKVKERESIRSEQGTIPSSDGTEPVMKQTGKTPPPSSTPPVAVYGGHGQGWWRGQYASLRQGIKAIEGGLADKREKLAELKRKRIIYQRTRDRVAYNQMEEDIKSDEAQLKEAQDRLNALDGEANSAGVPQEWRQ
ncbi:DUF4124 domain-containing protein [Geobacter sp. AOG1]|uniref:DUF4124 domain-containing protein n=1 Tax=Geobacter sp. AOG1 TaxID=1566346 RepID=UPI001CC63E61|nr:DUF4124 domain-containing protein [Geobacter sp. AOG1]GFE58705.1 hypothetical protein AOG1_25850 [Geobacter sp. AOG1]